MKASQIVALDDFALQAARGLSARHACVATIRFRSCQATTPVLTDIAVISRPQAIPGGGYDYGVTPRSNFKRLSVAAAASRDRV